MALLVQLRWETNVKNGVCGVSFDRRDIPMNKFMVTCLESVFHVYDARTFNPSKVGQPGIASLNSQAFLQAAVLMGSLSQPAQAPAAGRARLPSATA